MEQRIFILEDDPVIREQLQVLLQGSGYETKAALDFGNAASQVREYEPHLVLLDIKLPGVSGFSICSQIRSFSQEAYLEKCGVWLSRIGYFDTGHASEAAAERIEARIQRKEKRSGTGT